MSLPPPPPEPRRQPPPPPPPYPAYAVHPGGNQIPVWVLVVAGIVIAVGAAGLGGYLMYQNHQHTSEAQFGPWRFFAENGDDSGVIWFCGIRSASVDSGSGRKLVIETSNDPIPEGSMFVRLYTRAWNLKEGSKLRVTLDFQDGRPLMLTAREAGEGPVIDIPSEQVDSLLQRVTRSPRLRVIFPDGEDSTWVIDGSGAGDALQKVSIPCPSYGRDSASGGQGDSKDDSNPPWIEGSPLVAQYGEYFYQTLSKVPTLVEALHQLRPGFDPKDAGTNFPSRVAKLPDGRMFLVMSGCRPHACPDYEAIVGMDTASGEVFMYEDGEQDGSAEKTAERIYEASKGEPAPDDPHRWERFSGRNDEAVRTLLREASQSK